MGILFRHVLVGFTSHQGSKFCVLSPPQKELVVVKRLGADTAWAADPNWPRGYSIPCGILLSRKSSGRGGGRGDSCGMEGVKESNRHNKDESVTHWHTRAYISLFGLVDFLTYLFVFLTAFRSVKSPFDKFHYSITTGIWKIMFCHQRDKCLFSLFNLRINLCCTK